MRETSSGRTNTRTYTKTMGSLGLVAVFLTAGLAGARRASAEETPPPPAAAAPAPVEAAPAAPVMVMPPPPAAPPVIEVPKPPTAAETMPATRPDALPPIDVGAWTRVGSVFQGTDPKKLNDWHMDHAYVELHAGGKVHKNVGVTLNLNADMLNFATSNVQIMDAIISFDFDDAFHVWAGHLLVPVDRSNASGPFFMIPWNYPGILTIGTTTNFWLPKEGPFGRNNGAVIWGDIASAKLTYLVGVFDNANLGSSPLFSGRLRLALWDAETGFWGNGSYFGEKDMLTIGVGGQFQKHGSTSTVGTTMVDKDYSEINADVLVEKKLGGGGWVTGEGAYYHYGVNDNAVSDSLYVLAAYASPTVGVGNVQPMVRYQWFKVKGDGAPKPWNLDAAVSYLIKGPALRVIASYSYTKFAPDVTANAIQLGAQAIFF